ncbi:hypothetical protein [Cellulomonas soli]|uniref:Chaplin domain-containing protein n=1 Tax=Cellulomonas soli TaxID=931535 RepID=A0A512PGU9_9CELL|nr:hypothetical protein [Cellulomonas soli]NYI59635.1 hypothetical protein [Cellulomonas soli]GEP70429.1 hypothetical protein CSO01_31440 [Cellulomonas soli]
MKKLSIALVLSLAALTGVVGTTASSAQPAVASPCCKNVITIAVR